MSTLPQVLYTLGAEGSSGSAAVVGVRPAIHAGADPVTTLRLEPGCILLGGTVTGRPGPRRCQDGPACGYTEPVTARLRGCSGPV
eukprot:746001-Hanusia_phi.AAC.4